jgi:hypothetical protein
MQTLYQITMDLIESRLRVHLFKFDNDIRGLNKIAHVDLKQNLCHDISFREQITNMLWHHGSSIDSYLK